MITYSLECYYVKLIGESTLKNRKFVNNLRRKYEPRHDKTSCGLAKYSGLKTKVVQSHLVRSIYAGIISRILQYSNFSFCYSYFSVENSFAMLLHARGYFSGLFIIWYYINRSRISEIVKACLIRYNVLSTEWDSD